MFKKLNWQNLRNNKCPKCNADIAGWSQLDEHLRCSCDFRISEQRFKEIVMDMNTQEVEKTFKLDKI